MPIYELRNEKQQVRFLPGGDTVTIYTYDIEDGEFPDRWGKTKTMPVKVARSYWGGLLSIGFERWS